MSEYKTQQKELLLAFLYANRETPFTVDEIAARMRETFDNAPGKSTVYRLMGKLCDEGSVKRFEKGNSRTFLYQYAGEAACRRHLHMKCLQCGKLLHMQTEQSEQLLREIFGNSDFEVDRQETTLFGRCAQCRKKAPERPVSQKN